jgi:hypothetical protein
MKVFFIRIIKLKNSSVYSHNNIVPQFLHKGALVECMTYDPPGLTNNGIEHSVMRLV